MPRHNPRKKQGPGTLKGFREISGNKKKDLIDRGVHPLCARALLLNLRFPPCEECQTTIGKVSGDSR